MTLQPPPSLLASEVTSLDLGCFSFFPECFNFVLPRARPAGLSRGLGGGCARGRAAALAQQRERWVEAKYRRRLFVFPDFAGALACVQVGVVKVVGVVVVGARVGAFAQPCSRQRKRKQRRSNDIPAPSFISMIKGGGGRIRTACSYPVRGSFLFIFPLLLPNTLSMAGPG